MNPVVSLFAILLLRVVANPSNPSHGICTLPTRAPTHPPPPPLLEHLVPLSTFLKAFQIHHLHLPATTRPATWPAFLAALTPRLQTILASNATAPGPGPLLLNHDLTLHKTTPTATGWTTQTVSKISASALVPPSVADALHDGFSLTLHHLPHRIPGVNTLTASLSRSFGVRVTADYTLHPGATGPAVSSHDEFHIVLSGSCKCALHKASFRYPLAGHVDDDGLLPPGDGAGAELALRVGDVVYVPRGDALAVDGAVSLLTVRLHTDEVTNAHALKGVLDVASVREGNGLSEELPGSRGLLCYADLVEALVHVAAEVTEELRKHFAVGEGIIDGVDEDAVDVVGRLVERFCGAAHALFDPGMEVLAEADDAMGQWARGVAEVDVDVVRLGFERVVEWVRGGAFAEDGVAEVFIKWFERRAVEEEVETALRGVSLRRVEQSAHWVTDLVYGARGW